MVSAILYGLLGLLVAVYYYLYRKSRYWEGKGLPHTEASILFGHYWKHIKGEQSLGDVCEKFCHQFPKEPVIGTVYGTEPAVIVKDPEMLKAVFTRDFYYFNSRELAEHSHRELITRNMFNESGDYWKVLRQNLTPLFSSSKMKAMFHLIELNTNTYAKLLEEEMKTSLIQDIKEFNLRYTMDCIGSCIFGIETNVLGDNTEKNPFRQIGRAIFNFNFNRRIRFVMRSIWPSFYFALRLQGYNERIGHFFKNLLNRVFTGRNFEPGPRNDFMDYLLTFKSKEYIEGDAMTSMKSKEQDKKKVQIKVTDDLLAAQCLLFFAAGFETSSTTMTLSLFELAKDQKAQQRVYEEFTEYLKKTEGKVTYEVTTELPYLEACVDESLRLYPVLGALTREVVEDYTFPNGLKLEKGMRVFIPSHYLQKHPDYWPEPLKYDPERFFGDNKHKHTPYTYFPFGEGMRICLGKRFGRMQIYAGLVTILRKYRVELAPGMPRDIELDPTSIVIVPKNPVMLKFIERNRVYEELTEYLKTTEGKVTYEVTRELPYLEACVDETLRLYPVLGVLTREVVQDYTLPNGVKLEKGMRVFIPSHYIQKHPDYWPEPLKYDSERFFGDNKHKHTPYTYFPFGEGMRICLGKRFGRIQIYAGLVTVLRKYRVELAPRMPRDLEMDPKTTVIVTKYPVLLKFIERN